MIGSTLAHYKVTGKLGEGGMGEVWRAEDTKLGRDVALKMLPDLFARDPERLARFEREARVLASLSHTNIAAVHGLEEVGGQRFLIMEVAEGEDLAVLLKRRGALPVDEAVRLAQQIAEGVEAAHEKGVVHRDLKPANVVVDPSGRVKILDFGLAKALGADGASGSDPRSGSDQDLSLSPTLTQAMTGAGVLLGTAGYMSPEQARGQAVDRRADIWAFGCILYEMLTGQRLFTGPTATDVIGAIVHKEPDLDQLPAAVPARLRRLIGRCLQKDVRRRLQSIGDARIALQEYLEQPGEEVVEPASTASPVWQRWLPWGVAAAALAIAAVALTTRGDEDGAGAAERLRRLDVRMGDTAFDYSLGSAVVVAPDGGSVAYVTGQAGSSATLWRRPLDRSESIEVVSGPGTDTAPYHPFYSPDGQWLGYVIAAEMKKISVTGGTPMTLAPVERSRGASWGERGIVYTRSPADPLSLVPATGGEPTEITTLDESRNEASHRWPQWLPDGRTVLFTVATSSTNAENAWLEVVDVESGERKTVHGSGYYGRYVETGHLLYADDNTVFALPFDLERLEVTGAPVPVLDDVAGASAEGTAHFDVSEDGLLVYLTGEGPARLGRLVWVSRDGRSETLWSEPGVYGNPRLSPDGGRVSVSLLRDNNWDVWAFDLERSVATRLTFDPGYDADQVWSPDGAWVAFASNRGGAISIYKTRSDGGGDAELVEENPAGGDWYPIDWSPDGSVLVVQSAAQAGDLWIVPVDGEDEPRPFQASAFAEGSGHLSPDGRMIVYQSNESGREEVYVRPFPEGAGKWQISEGGGGYPIWSRDGREIFYRTDEGIAVVSVDATAGLLRAERRRTLFEGDYQGGISGVVAAGFVFPDYDAARDGGRFVMLADDREEEQGEHWVRLVTGWFSELESLVPTR